MPEWISSIRSLATLMIVGSFCYLAVVGKVDSKDVMAVVMMVLGFYFVTKDRDVPPEVKP